jgi:Zn-dependent protease
MLILSVTVHEFSHAFAADKLGDDLPSREGRLTLNPIAHIDPIGTLLVPAIAAFSGIALFGWGRPVYTNPISYTRKFSMSAGEALVSFAGPLSNLLLGILCGGLWAVLRKTGVLMEQPAFEVLLRNMVSLNMVLFVLNLLPFPPLDGSKIVAWIFGYKADRTLDFFSSLGIVGLYLVLLVAGSFISWIANFAFNTIINGFSGLLS